MLIKLKNNVEVAVATMGEIRAHQLLNRSISNHSEAEYRQAGDAIIALAEEIKEQRINVGTLSLAKATNVY